MSFNQSALARATVQSQGIFNNYVYRTSDTIAQVKAAGYFAQSQFATLDGPATGSNGWNGGNIEAYCSDGYAVLRIDSSTGTASALFVSPAVISQIDVMSALSTTNQIPGVLGTPIQVSFGSLQTTPQFDLSAAGSFTCKISGRYQFVFTAQAGRTGGAGVVNLMVRLTKNGTQLGNTALARLDNAATVVPLRFPVSFDLVAADVLAAFIVQDTSGIAGAGGLYSVASANGWSTSPSAAVMITQLTSVV